MVVKEVEEVPAKEVEIGDEGDDVVKVTAKRKKKKVASKIEKKLRVRKPNKHVEDSLKILPRQFQQMTIFLNTLTSWFEMHSDL